MHFETCKYQGGQSRGLPGLKVRNRTSQVRKNVYNFRYTKSNFMGYSANSPSYFSTQTGLLQFSRLPRTTEEKTE